MRAMLDLEPKRLWKYFFDICAIPRSSGHEEKIRNYLISKSSQFGLISDVDGAGNLVIKKKGLTRYSTNSPVILQCHMDMICDNDINTIHDPLNDPIIPIIDGDWVRAKGTTLGADNGIGLAASLTIMESNELKHGPLEFLITTNEEGGLCGAKELKIGFVKGSTMINLDSEEEGKLFVGCSGDDVFLIGMPFQRRTKPVGDIGLKLNMTGLMGGHSGLDIHCERGNSIKLIARLLRKLDDECNISLSSLTAGTRKNAIPRAASAIIATSEIYKQKIKFFTDELVTVVKNELGENAANLEIEIEDIEVNEILSNKDFLNIIDLIYLLPSGVISYNPDMTGLIQTSCNLATINMGEDKFFIELSCRSSVASEMCRIKETLFSLSRLQSVDVSVTEHTPGWPPNLNSSLLKIMKQTFGDIYGKKPELEVLHACLECSVIAEKYPNIEMVSFGPEIVDCHTTRERVNITSVTRFWKLLTRTLEKLTTA